MKKAQLYTGSIALAVGLAACNGNGTTSTSDSTRMNQGDSSVTTTTTTTVTHHKYTGTFMPKPNTKYIDIRTHKQVQIRLDSVQGIVNSETNMPVDLFVEPGTTDTIYGRTGTVVNNYIAHGQNDDYSIDESKLPITDVQPTNVTPDTPATPSQAAVPSDGTPVAGDAKYKEKDGKSKYKDADVKVKERNGIIKTKER